MKTTTPTCAGLYWVQTTHSPYAKIVQVVGNAPFFAIFNLKAELTEDNDLIFRKEESIGPNEIEKWGPQFIYPTF